MDPNDPYVTVTVVGEDGVTKTFPTPAVEWADRPACTHLRIEYMPRLYPDGSQSDEWRCFDCNTEFRPIHP